MVDILVPTARLRFRTVESDYGLVPRVTRRCDCDIRNEGAGRISLEVVAVSSADIRRRAAQLKAEQERRERIADDANRRSMAELHRLFRELEALRLQARDTADSPPVQLYDNAYVAWSDRGFEDDYSWSGYVGSEGFSGAPSLSFGLGSYSYNPIKRHWVYRSDAPQVVQRDAIVGAYKDRLAWWIVNERPRLEAEANAAARTAAQDEARRQEELKRDLRRNGWGCLGIVAFVLFVISWDVWMPVLFRFLGWLGS